MPRPSLGDTFRGHLPGTPYLRVGSKVSPGGVPRRCPQNERLRLVARLDLLAPRLVLGLVRLGLLDRLRHVLLRETRGRSNGDLVLLPGRAVLRHHVDDAVRVDIEGDLDLRHAARSGRNSVEME